MEYTLHRAGASKEGDDVMPHSYLGIDVAQIILGGAIIIVFVFFAVWGFRVSRSSKSGDTKSGTKPS